MASRDLTLILKARDEASKVLGDAASRTEKAGAAMKAAMLAASAAAGAAMVQLGRASIDAASDLNESMSKSTVVFGEAQAAMEQFYGSAATNLGLTKQQAAEAAGTFGNLFTAMGIGQQPAADMSKQILALSADLASFNNMDPTEVLEKLRSGLVGETEPLRSLGVNLSAATIEAKAMQMGLADANGELSASAKAQASLALIMEQTKTAQGDFARTSDGLANSQRILKAELGNLQAEMGTQLLPIALQAVAVFRDVLTVFSGLDPTLKLAIVGGVGLLAVIGPLVTAFGAVSTALGVVIPLVGALNVVLLANPVGLVVIALAALAAGLIYAYNNVEPFRKAVDDAWAALKTGVEGALAWATKAVADLSAAFQTVVQWLKDNWQPVVGLLISGPFAPLVLVATDAFGVRSALVNGLQALVKTVGEKAKEIGQGILDGIKAGIDDGWDWLMREIGNLVDRLIQEAKNKLGIKSPSSVFEEIGGWIVVGLSKGLDELGSVNEKMGRFLRDMSGDVAKAARAMGSAFSAAFEWSLGMSGFRGIGGGASAAKSLIEQLEAGGLSGPVDPYVIARLRYHAEALGQLEPQAEVVNQIRAMIDAYGDLGITVGDDLIWAVRQVADSLGGPFHDALEGLVGPAAEASRALQKTLDEMSLAQQIAQATVAYGKLGMGLPWQFIELLRNLPREIGGILDRVINAILNGEAIPSFQRGGIVPGSFGSRQLIMAHGGETVVPRGAGGLTVIVNVQGSVLAEADLAETVRRQLLTTRGRNYTTGF